MSELIPGLIPELQALLGAGGVLTEEDVSSRSAGWGRGACEAMAVVRPCSTEEVSAVLRLCHQHGQVVVTQGGKTGLVDGSVAGPNEIALSLERMTKVEKVEQCLQL